MIQDPAKTGMADVAIAMGALTWYVPDASKGLAPLIWRSLTPPFIALGWGPDEFHTVSAASAAGGGVVASDWAQNLDALSSYDVPSLAPRAPVRGAPRVAGTKTHTAAFLMSDGDNVQWLLGGFASSAAYFGSPDRGHVPMGWTVSSSLIDLAPAALHYLYRTASDGSELPFADCFVAGLSGASYSYVNTDYNGPGFAQKLSLSLASAAKAGLRTQNVMTDGDTLPPEVAAAYLAPTSPLDAIFHYSYADYALGGGISFVGEKPVIEAKFNLWGDGSMGHNFFNVSQAAASLAAASRDPTTSAGYSLIVVHAWTHNVSDARAVMDLANALAPGGVEFVTPDVLAARVAANVVH